MMITHAFIHAIVTARLEPRLKRRCTDNQEEGRRKLSWLVTHTNSKQAGSVTRAWYAFIIFGADAPVILKGFLLPSYSFLWAASSFPLHVLHPSREFPPPHVAMNPLSLEVLEDKVFGTHEHDEDIAFSRHTGSGGKASRKRNSRGHESLKDLNLVVK